MKTIIGDYNSLGEGKREEKSSRTYESLRATNNMYNI